MDHAGHDRGPQGARRDRRGAKGQGVGRTSWRASRASGSTTRVAPLSLTLPRKGEGNPSAIGSLTQDERAAQLSLLPSGEQAGQAPSPLAGEGGERGALGRDDR